VQVYYYLFDLLYLNGYDLRELPLIHRKELLRQTFDLRDPLGLTEHRKARVKPISAKLAAKVWKVSSASVPPVSTSLGARSIG
jgi:bifunctional non-homologous end joining protein LigD